MAGERLYFWPFQIKGPDNPTYESTNLKFLKHKAVRVSIASTTRPCQEVISASYNRGVGEKV